MILAFFCSHDGQCSLNEQLFNVELCPRGSVNSPRPHLLRKAEILLPMGIISLFVGSPTVFAHTGCVYFTSIINLFPKLLCQIKDGIFSENKKKSVYWFQLLHLI